MGADVKLVTEADRLRTRLREAVDTVPGWIATASITRTVQWKEDCAKARKVLARGNASAHELGLALKLVTME
jgi:hypothetical protein